MKTDRHKKILEVIDRYEVGTQEELAKILNDEGYNVTQATVSRDIRELNLSKVSVDGKRTRYATLTKDKPVASDKFLTVLKEGFVSMDMAQNILVIKTAPGMAMAVCAAIDALEWNEIVGHFGPCFKRFSCAGNCLIGCYKRMINRVFFVNNRHSRKIRLQRTV